MSSGRQTDARACPDLQTRCQTSWRSSDQDDATLPPATSRIQSNNVTTVTNEVPSDSFDLQALYK